MPSKTEARFKDLGHKFIVDPSEIREREEKDWLRTQKSGGGRSINEDIF
jgi:hypothetical protein